MSEARVGLNICIPNYSLGEEIFNAVSHGIGGLMSIAGLTLLLIRARGPLAVISVSLFGAAMVILYVVSCVYHALSRRTEGKKVLRVIDHCNVFLLVMCTYVPVSLLGVGGALGWALLSGVSAFAVTGIVFNAIRVDRFKVLSVVCHLASGWSILLGVPRLLETMGPRGVLFLVLGGVLYSIGAALYGVGAKKRYVHSVFHLFCLAGTFFHFWAVYIYLL